MTSREFEKWRAMDLVDPWWLPERIDVALAQVCAVVTNTRFGRRGAAKPAAKFIPEYEDRARKVLRILNPATCTPAADLEAQFVSLTRQMGGTVVQVSAKET